MMMIMKVRKVKIKKKEVKKELLRASKHIKQIINRENGEAMRKTGTILMKLTRKESLYTKLN